MHMRMKWMERLGWILLFLVLWEGSVKLLHVSSLLFPSVEEVVMTIYDGVVHGDLIWQSLYSVGMIGVSLAISGGLAVALALLSTWSKVFESLIDTLIRFPAWPCFRSSSCGLGQEAALWLLLLSIPHCGLYW